MIVIIVIAAVRLPGLPRRARARQLPARPRPRPPRHQPVLVIRPRPVDLGPRPVRHPDRPPPLTITGRSPVKKLLGWVALGIVVLWVINNPTQADALIHQVGHAVATLTH